MVLQAVKWAVHAALLLQVLQYSASANGIDIGFETLEREQEERSNNDLAAVPPGPFNPRPSTENMIRGHEKYLTKMKADISPYSSESGSTASASLSATPASKKSDDNITSRSGGSSENEGDDLSDLLSGLTGSEGEDSELSKMLGGSGSTASFEDFVSSMGPNVMGGLGALFGMADPTLPQNITVDDEDIIYGEVYGSKEHGDAFSDINNLKFGQFIVNITIRGADRVDQFGIMPMTQETVGNLIHGGTGGGLAYVEPDINKISGNIIDSIEVHWEKHNGKTCIFYLEVIVGDGQKLSAGRKTTNSSIIKPPNGFEIGGFHGRATSSGIYGIGAIFMKKGVQNVAVTDVMSVPETGSPTIYHYRSTIRNWVGPVEVGEDGGCYMKRHNVNHENVCPSGYRQDDGKCITQCPLNYPVDCFLECIPQNSDCGQAVAAKVVAVVAAALNIATLNMFGTLMAQFKAANFFVRCAAAVFNAVRSLVFYLRYTQITIPHSNIEKLFDLSFRMQIVILDLPMAVCACLGLKIPNNLMFPVIIVTIVSAIVMMAVMVGEILFHSRDNVLMMMRESGAMNGSLLSRDVLELDDFLNKQNTTCGFEIQTLTNRVIGKVNEIRVATPNADEDDVRVEVSKSPIMTEDVPIITNHCMGEVWTNHTGASAYTTRRILRKSLGLIIEQLIKDGTTDMAKNMVKKEKAVKYSNLGLFFLSMLDPTGIAWMASEFVQPICGPTEFLGEIDDGHLHEALGLTTIDAAFEGSYGIWKKKGDGSVNVHFESFDKYDVDVVIYSGGEKINEVKVPAGGKVTWKATVNDLEDKTLYMDRWRPGLFGLPGSGGGSLLLWVPRSSLGGYLILHARVNVS